MGDTTMRLGKVMPRSVIGEKSALMVLIFPNESSGVDTDSRAEG